MIYGLGEVTSDIDEQLDLVGYQQRALQPARAAVPGSSSARAGAEKQDPHDRKDPRWPSPLRALGDYREAGGGPPVPSSASSHHTWVVPGG